MNSRTYKAPPIHNLIVRPSVPCVDLADDKVLRPPKLRINTRKPLVSHDAFIRSAIISAMARHGSAQYFLADKLANQTVAITTHGTEPKSNTLLPKMILSPTNSTTVSVATLKEKLREQLFKIRRSETESIARAIGNRTVVTACGPTEEVQILLGKIGAVVPNDHYVNNIRIISYDVGVETLNSVTKRAMLQTASSQKHPLFIFENFGITPLRQTQMPELRIENRATIHRAVGVQHSVILIVPPRPQQMLDRQLDTDDVRYEITVYLDPLTNDQVVTLARSIDLELTTDQIKQIILFYGRDTLTILEILSVMKENNSTSEQICANYYSLAMRNNWPWFRDLKMFIKMNSSFESSLRILCSDRPLPAATLDLTTKLQLYSLGLISNPDSSGNFSSENIPIFVKKLIADRFL